jgi:hypothetical protein
MFLRNEGDAHAPAGMDAEQTPELFERESRLIDMNRDLVIGVAAVVDDAAQDISAREPLVAIPEIFDLWLAQLDFEDSLFQPGSSGRSWASIMPLNTSTTSRSVMVLSCGPMVIRVPEISGSAYSMITSLPSRVMRT